MKIAIYGLGNVGRGLLQIIREQKPDIEIAGIVDRSYTRKKEILLDIPASDDPEFLLKNENVDVHIELMGGLETAMVVVREALDRGKPVITANKALLAEHGYSLFFKSREKKAPIYFEAAIAGAIPIVTNIKNILGYQPLNEMQGILNGTTNFILTHMRTKQQSFHEVLVKAQSMGLAEADPSLDINGTDAVHKLALLATLITGKWFEYKNIYTSGIENIQIKDMLWAEKMGYRIRLIAEFRREPAQTFASVEPSMIDKNNFLWDVENENNAILLKGLYSNDHLFAGKGAGALPTAYSVYTDLINLKNAFGGLLPDIREYAEISKTAETADEFYLRLLVEDKPGVLATVSEIFKKHKISIAKLHQESQNETQISDKVTTPPVDLIIVTHKCKRDDLNSALAEFEKEDFTQEHSILMPIKRS